MAIKYISPTGNDSTGDGSLATPYLTITKALQQTTTGDTIYLLAGTYTTTNVPTGTSITNRTITGAGSATTIVDYAAGTYGAGLLTFGTATFSNIQFYRGVGTAIANGKLFVMDPNSTLNLTNCLFNANTAYGSYGSPAFAGTYYGDAVTINMTGCIMYNMEQKNSDSGLFEGRNYAGHTINLYNNVFHSKATATYGIIVFGAWGTNPVGVMKNNIFYRASGPACTVKNNGTITYNNNCAYGYSGVPTGNNNITSDPLFVDAANLNFALRATSPCINTGTLI